MTNPYGDVELDAAGMRALAHPLRIALLQELRRSGPATATQLSQTVDASPSTISWHLRHLAEFGLVHDVPERGRGRERWWEAVHGFRFAATDDATRAVAGQLQGLLAEAAGDVVGDWRREVAPQLEPEWIALAASHDTTIAVTLTELAELNAAIENLMAPYVNRREAPTKARPVRILRDVLPEGRS